MDGRQAIEYIHSFYGLGKKEGLSNGFELMRLLGNPHERLRCVHVAGTNGKGSICTYIDSVLRAHGYKVGLYTSPYLQSYNERIRVDGEPIADEDLGRAAEAVKTAVEAMHASGAGKPTEFEIGTAIAFAWFDMARVDYAVVEVGLGGRLDPTNIITPMVSVIGNIGLDHTNLLGDTLEKIAFEKAGIIKPGMPVAVYPQGEGVLGVIKEVCDQRGCAMHVACEDDVSDVVCDLRGASFEHSRFGPLRINIPGRYQVCNALTALKALELMRSAGVALSEADVRRGMEAAFWPGRLEWLDGRTLLDGAHNPQGAKALADYVCRYIGGARVALVCGILRGKDYPSIIAELARFAGYVAISEPEGHRTLDPALLADEFCSRGVQGDVFAALPDAISAARAFAGDGGYVVIAGSLYLAGAARTFLLG